MEQSKRFLHCTICGNLVGQLHDSGVEIYCCNRPIEVLEANKGGDQKKHQIDCKVDRDQVKVSIAAGDHPMNGDHHIDWIYLETDQGGQRKNLAAADTASACFAIGTEKPLAVYAYCNQHGLWRSNI